MRTLLSADQANQTPPDTLGEYTERVLNYNVDARRRQPVGIVEGSSDHCEDRCLHWGLKRGTADYLDPQQYAGSRKIVLKPS